ncbi:hypothetical protein Vafri_6904 [Volvox africanus]|uniref:Uncharacterized protein n=1 Tax=Volvox africanus TaxID=51714 RepID=A0A8J4AZM4_9CHLO|nr:hypothetical protein Vafri_6904 [Volvox africanus]
MEAFSQAIILPSVYILSGEMESLQQRSLSRVTPSLVWWTLVALLALHVGPTIAWPQQGTTTLGAHRLRGGLGRRLSSMGLIRSAAFSGAYAGAAAGTQKNQVTVVPTAVPAAPAPVVVLPVAAAPAPAVVPIVVPVVAAMPMQLVPILPAGPPPVPTAITIATASAASFAVSPGLAGVLGAAVVTSQPVMMAHPNVQG